MMIKQPLSGVRWSRAELFMVGRGAVIMLGGPVICFGITGFLMTTDWHFPGGLVGLAFISLSCVALGLACVVVGPIEPLVRKILIRIRR